MTEQLALDQFARDRGHVYGNEGSLAALAVVVQHARHELLARAAFARDHDRQFGLRQTRERPIDFLHRGRTADQRQLLAIRTFRPALRLAAGSGESARDDRDDLGEIEGFGQILVSALLGRRQRRHQRVLRTHDDDRQVGTQLLDARNEIEGVFVRHDDIGNDHVTLALAHPAPERRRVARGPRSITSPRQRLIEHRADRRIVIGDEDRTTRHIIHSPGF